MNHNTLPLVSVIVPGYNHAPFLEQRISSILDQTYPNTELILLDDCSTDGSAEIMRRYENHPKVKAVVVNSENSGSTFRQWKRGLEMAEGKYVWIAESDDSASTDFLTELVAQLETHNDAAMAFSGSRMIDARGEVIPGMDWDRWSNMAPLLECIPARKLIETHLLVTSNIYNASQVLMRRSAIPCVTDQQCSMRYCGDWLFWVNLLAGADCAVAVRLKLNRFRQHDRKVSPTASRQGRYFTEGIPVMIRVAEVLGLNSLQRRVLAGRTIKRLSRFKDIDPSDMKLIAAHIDRLSPGADIGSHTLPMLYEADKLMHFSGLQFPSLS